MKTKFIAILTISTLAFFANASAKSDASDMKSVKAEITAEISAEVQSEVVDKADIKKMREESKEARKGLLDKIKLENILDAVGFAGLAVILDAGIGKVFQTVIFGIIHLT